MTTITPEHVLDAFTEQTRGDGGEVVGGQILLDTVRGIRVVAYQGGEGWWEARIEVRAYVGTDQEDVVFTAPLLQGPVWYDDSDTTVQDVVDWLRVLCDAAPDRDEVEA